MTASRPSGRARSTALAAAGLTVLAAALAPAASAEPAAAPGYSNVAPPQGTQVLPVKYGPTPSTAHHTTTRVRGTKHSSDTLAYTGAEVGALAAGGLLLVVGGSVLVRAGRRRSASAA